MPYWLMKSEPDEFSIEDLQKRHTARWDGVRNYQARNNLREMKEGDLALFYHSNEGKEVVGIAKIVKEAYQDPTTDDTNWVVVELEPVEALKKPVTLAQIKADPMLKDIQLIKLSRLSVASIKAEEFDHILQLGNS